MCKCICLLFYYFFSLENFILFGKWRGGRCAHAKENTYWLPDHKQKWKYKYRKKIYKNDITTWNWKTILLMLLLLVFLCGNLRTCINSKISPRNWNRLSVGCSAIRAFVAMNNILKTAKKKNFLLSAIVNSNRFVGIAR